MSFPWKYRTVSAGREISGCETIIAEPDEDGNGEVGSLLLVMILQSVLFNVSLRTQSSI